MTIRDRTEKETELVDLLVGKTRGGEIRWEEIAVASMYQREFKTEHRGYSFKLRQGTWITLVVSAPVVWHGDIGTSKEICTISQSSVDRLSDLWKAIPQIGAEKARAILKKEENYQELVKTIGDLS